MAEAIELLDYLEDAVLVQEGSAYSAVAFCQPILYDGMLINYALVNTTYGCPEVFFSTEEGVRAGLEAKEVGVIICNSASEADVIQWSREADKEKESATLQ